MLENSYCNHIHVLEFRGRALLPGALNFDDVMHLSAMTVLLQNRPWQVVMQCADVHVPNASVLLMVLSE